MSDTFLPATPVPFAFTFDPATRLVSGEAMQSSVTTYTVNPDGTLAYPQSASDNQAALCWIVRAGGYYYVGFGSLWAMWQMSQEAEEDVIDVPELTA